MTNGNSRAVPLDRPYMGPVDVRAAVFHLDVTTIEPENTGNTYEFTHL